MPPRTGERKKGQADALPRLGAHMSIAGGMPGAVVRARSVEATALQVFVKSANQWAARSFAPGEAQEFRRALWDAGLARHTLAHSSYLVNLASPDEALWRRSMEALREEMERSRELGIPFLVVHPGAHMCSGEALGLKRIASALDQVLDGGRSGEVTILLEITAGQGTSLGSTFEQLARILDLAAHAERLGVCFDTCHALAAGYEFRDGRSYREMIRALDKTVSLERVKAFHLNDSRTALGSHRDRHAAIGHGEVGLEAFRLILNDPRFRDLPMVLETPKGDDLSEDRRNLRVLRAMIAR